MKIRIYQINDERDENMLMFRNYDFISKVQEIPGVDSSIYDKIYEADLDCKNLEEVYVKFNVDHPDDFRGHSLSVSDVVEVYESEDIQQGFYFCDSVGFKKIDFNPELCEENEKNEQGVEKLSVIYLKTNELAKKVEIDYTLETMQKLVGGYIETISLSDDGVLLVCNDESKINGSPLNRAIYNENIKEIDMSYGEMTNLFRDCESKGDKHLTGYIVFTEDSFSKPYSVEARTYAVKSNNKAFMPNMGGYSIYGSALDGTDNDVRLEAYMASEKGGKDGWKIERCYMKQSEKEMVEIIAGDCFICGVKGENFASLSAEMTEKYMKLFKYPDMFFRAGKGIEAIPFDPEKNRQKITSENTSFEEKINAAEKEAKINRDDPFKNDKGRDDYTL